MKHDRERHSWYSKQIWKGPNGVRAMKLRRDPICEVIGCTRPATTVDHRTAFMQGKDDAERWSLFLGGEDLQNLRSCCQPHHDAKPLAAEKPGAPEYNPVSATGEQGRQFTSSSVSQAQINRAMDFDVAELLRGIPEVSSENDRDYECNWDVTPTEIQKRLTLIG